MLSKVQEALDNGNNVVREIRNKNRHGNSLEDWCFLQQEDRKWGSSLDMEFLSYFHGVNIISISNSSGGRGSLETYRTLRTSVPSGSLNENDPVIFIYHHMYNRPFEVNRADDIVFERHLASLSENLVYAALTAVHTALTLQN